MRPVDWFSTARPDYFFSSLGAIFPVVKKMKIQNVISKISVLLQRPKFYLHCITRLLCYYIVDMDYSLYLFMLKIFIKFYLNCDLIWLYNELII
jgi:hypothetical protein